jgi:hypothetical protein
MGRTTNAYRILVGKSKSRRIIVIYRGRRKNDIKTDRNNKPLHSNGHVLIVVHMGGSHRLATSGSGRMKWKGFLDDVMDGRVPQNGDNFLTSEVIIIFQ